MPVGSRSRKSATIRLVLMGAAVGGSGLLAGCGTDVQRNRYTSREDCVADYSEAQCRPDFPIGSAIGAGVATYYFGPWYRSDPTARRGDPNDPGAGRWFSSGSSVVGGGRSPATVEVGSRGGFGSTGRVSARGS